MTGLCMSYLVLHIHAFVHWTGFTLTRDSTLLHQHKPWRFYRVRKVSIKIHKKIKHGMKNFCSIYTSPFSAQQKTNQTSKKPSAGNQVSHSVLWADNMNLVEIRKHQLEGFGQSFSGRKSLFCSSSVALLVICLTSDNMWLMCMSIFFSF